MSSPRPAPGIGGGRGPSVPARGAGLLLALALVVLLQLAVLYAPGDAVPSAGLQVPGLDKLVHAAVFALPAALIRTARLGRLPLVLLALHAPVSELLQLTLVPHRTGDPWDVAADLVGLLAGTLAGALWERRRPRSAGRLEEGDGRGYTRSGPPRGGHDLGL